MLGTHVLPWFWAEKACSILGLFRPKMEHAVFTQKLGKSCARRESLGYIPRHTVINDDSKNTDFQHCCQSFWLQLELVCSLQVFSFRDLRSDSSINGEFGGLSRARFQCRTAISFAPDQHSRIAPGLRGRVCCHIAQLRHSGIFW